MRHTSDEDNSKNVLADVTAGATSTVLYAFRMQDGDDLITFLVELDGFDSLCHSCIASEPMVLLGLCELDDNQM